MRVSQKSDTGFWVSQDDLDTHCYFKRISNILIALSQKYNPNVIYDFGCGYGQYIKDINSVTGIKAVGFEGKPDKTFYENIVEADLAKPIILNEKSEMVISLEVGEHIPKEFEQTFLDNISNNASKIVILSWAVIGQGGNGHINCQNNDYIIEEMKKRGFRFNPKILEIRNFNDIEWFKNSLMMFVKN